MTAAELLLLALLVIFTAPYLLWRLMGRRRWAPLVVVQILAGVALGPAIFGRAFPQLHELVFSKEIITALNGIASWAVMLFVWVAGLELDLRQAWQKRGETGIVALLALAVPLAFGVAAAAFLLHTGSHWIGPRGAPWQALLGIGMACAVTALPILVLLMDHMGILRTPLGQRILRYASLDDVAIWAVLALILVNWEQIARQIGFLALFVPAAVLARRVIATAQAQDRWFLGLIWLAACGLAADWAGLHYMVGAFLSGMVLNRQWFGTENVDTFRSHILLAVMPVFFLSTGLRTNWDIRQFDVFIAAGILLAASVAGKLVGMYVAGWLLRWKPREASVIGWLLQTKALIMIIFANVLLDKQIIDPQTFTALLLMAVGSTMLTMPMTMPLLRKLPQYSPS
ncbi:MAG: cation:proton antiporter [Burkholderiaceae bacterium]|jgi:Kef-type K+ transport system membrane component KefB|nr:cation:proton antiporter [Burkholderiaceae bacterium]